MSTSPPSSISIEASAIGSWRGCRTVRDRQAPAGLSSPPCAIGALEPSSSRLLCKNLLIVPGKAFSSHDTHFRLSYAAADSTLEMGIEILHQLADKGKPDRK